VECYLVNEGCHNASLRDSCCLTGKSEPKPARTHEMCRRPNESVVE
jgi:hypothetical protein